MLRQGKSSFIQAVFSFEAMLLWESYWLPSNLQHCWARPLTPLWLAVERIQFLKTDQLTMRFAIIAVCCSFIWNHFILSQPTTTKKTQKNNSTAKKLFFSNLRQYLGLQGVFLAPYGGSSTDSSPDSLCNHSPSVRKSTVQFYLWRAVI